MTACAKITFPELGNIFNIQRLGGDSLDIAFNEKEHGQEGRPLIPFSSGSQVFSVERGRKEHLVNGVWEYWRVVDLAW